MLGHSRGNTPGSMAPVAYIWTDIRMIDTYPHKALSLGGTQEKIYSEREYCTVSTEVVDFDCLWMLEVAEKDIG